MENKYDYSDAVKFLPWVGINYEYGIKGFDENGIIVYGTKEDPGKKILVVGESHYCANLADAISKLTQIIIADLIDPNSEWEPYKNTYIKFIKSLTGHLDNLEFNDKKEAWEHLGFYNYVQEPMTGARISPTSEDFKNSEEAFWEVLNILKPDLIIIWGKRLYNNLPQAGKQLEDLEVVVNDLFQKKDSLEIWSYNNIPIMHIVHPSAAYSIDYFSRFIKAFILKY